MAVSTYAELQTAISGRIARSDFTSTLLQEFIAFAESDMQRHIRALDMETKSAAFSITGEYVNVPTDFLAVRDFYTNASPATTLTYMSPEQMTAQYRGVAGPALFYCVVGSQFRFAPPPSATTSATLVYYIKIPALSGSNTTNWLLTAHPDAYLYGSLKQAAIYIGDAAATQGYDALFKEALAGIRHNSNANRWTGPSMAVRAA